MKSKIIGVTATEIYNSQGDATLSCEILLENGNKYIASVPRGISRSKYETHEARNSDGSVYPAVETINTIIGPYIIGREPDVVAIDQIIIDLDGTPDKSNLGGNTTLAVSMAACKAQADEEQMELYELIACLSGYDSVSIPYPMFNMINGGAHGLISLSMQEILVIPLSAQSFHGALRYGTSLFHTLGKFLTHQGKFAGIGAEGGWVSNFASTREALDLLMGAIASLESTTNIAPMLALDVAASQLYVADQRVYAYEGQQYNEQGLVGYYESLLDDYPIYAIEDGLDQDAWHGWQQMTEFLSPRVHILGDDIFATHAERLWQGVNMQVGTGIIIKPNQVGTVTEAIQTAQLAKDSNKMIIVSHRSGETNDTFIVDFAVGVGAQHLKAGGTSRGERIAKYNRLLTIESDLFFS